MRSLVIASNATIGLSENISRTNKPSILFADEPTGNLDEETGEKVIQLLFQLNKEAGTTLVIITHDLELAAKTQKIIKLRGGKLDN